MMTTLEYYPPDSITGVKGVLWCAVVPGREAVWYRQLCTAWKLARREPKKVAHKVNQLTMF
jgi:hypothetical protein